MKRAFALIGSTMLICCLMFCTFSNLKAIGAALTASFVALVLSLIIKPLRKRKNIALVLLAVFVSCGVFLLHEAARQSDIKAASENTAVVQTRLNDLPYYNKGRKILSLKAFGIDGRNASLNLTVTTKEPVDIAPGDNLILRIKLNEPDTSDRETAVFDRSQDVALKGTIEAEDEYTLIKDCDLSPTQLLLKIRSFMADSITSALGSERGAVLCGLLLGERNGINPKSQTLFRNCGVLHLFAVSGLHLSIWSALVWEAVRRTGMNIRKCSAAAIIFTLLFMLVTGANPPVLRAGFMIIVLHLGNLFDRQADAYNSVGFAVCMLLIINPYICLSVSLWLSVLATLSIVTFSKKLYAFSGSMKRRIESVLIPRYAAISKGRELTAKFIVLLCDSVTASIFISLTVSAATLPIYAFCFGSISVIILLSNLIFVPLGAVLMQLGGVAAVLMCLGFNALGRLLFVPAGLLCKLTVWIAEKLGTLPVTLISVSSPLGKITVCVCIILLALAIIWRRKLKKAFPVCAVCTVLLFFAVNTAVYISDYSKPRIFVSDTGELTGAVITYKGSVIALDCSENGYGSQKLYFAARTIPVTKVEYLLTPNADLQRTLRSNYIFEHYSCENVFVFTDDSPKEENDFNLEETQGENFVIKKDDLLLTCEEKYVTIEFKGTKTVLVYGKYAAEPNGDIVIMPQSDFEMTEITLLPNGKYTQRRLDNA